MYLQITLNLSMNWKMELNGYKHLSKCLYNVCGLDLCGCGITPEQVEVLSRAISMLNDPVNV